MSYVKFYSNASFTLGTYENTKIWDGTASNAMEYSTDGSTWSTWTGTSVISAAATNGVYSLYLRGNGNTKVSNLTYGGWQNNFIFTGTQSIDSEGNIESLLDYQTVDNGQHPTMADFAFTSLFYNQTLLRTPPNLLSRTLTDRCYYSMFKDCTSLIISPELPALSLTYGCYTRMFEGCTALTSTSILPATTLATNCYNSMFYGCSSLTIPPELPATTLAARCYYSMFYNSGIKLSTTQHDDYILAYRIPTEGTGSTGTVGEYLNYMFYGSGVDTPVVNTTYYIQDTQYKSNQIELGLIAQAIRDKAEISSSLTFPEDYITEINNIVVDIDNTYLISQAVPSDALGSDGDICVVYN